MTARRRFPWIGLAAYTLVCVLIYLLALGGAHVAVWLWQVWP